ncbi:DNA ligase 1 isoform X2 [Morus notabilis]|uniref:DNA ligase 1 isoform X2 n=1 Tax=Morus notabilis TaxID=981085 RepID=UPI000CECE904|nr:DNA ligase 1 isoform X2 [Morus notabilis]
MVPDKKLAERLRDILRSSDLDTTTPGSVRRQLEADFGVDLSDRKAFIGEQIDLFLASHMANPQEEEVEEDGKEAEAEEEEKDDEDDSGSRGRRKGRSNKEDKVKKRGGFNKLCSLSPHLQEVVGEAEMSRPEVVKKLWSYIRENDLQDPKNKRNIICDESLQALFRVNTINMFQMNKALSKHIWPLSTEDENVRQKKKAEDIDHSESEEESNKAQKQEEEEEEEEEEDEKDSRRRKRKGRSAKVDKDVKKRGGGGFAKVCSLSPQLQAFIGEAELARTEVVKKLWSYIKENDLQDPKNKQNIICDESLRALFHVDRINMFQMNKALAKHIWPLNADNVTENSSQKEKQSKQEQEEEEEEDKEEDSDEPKKKEKRQKKGGSGFTAPLPLSDALVKFIGTGENTLSRADVVKRMWQYIKQNDLQDPSDKRRILCDDKLKELFDVDSFNGFSVTKLLTAHFVKTD